MLKSRFPARASARARTESWPSANDFRLGNFSHLQPKFGWEDSSQTAPWFLHRRCEGVSVFGDVACRSIASPTHRGIMHPSRSILARSRMIAAMRRGFFPSKHPPRRCRITSLRERLRREPVISLSAISALAFAFSFSRHTECSRMRPSRPRGDLDPPHTA